MNQKAVLYCRVSSPEQTDKWSLPSQERLLKEYSKKNGIEIVKQFVCTESGYKKNERKQFLEMLAFMKENRIEHLLCLNKERLLRDFRWYVMLEDRMNEDKIKIHFVEQGKILDGTNADEMFIFQLEVAMSKKFIADLGAKVRRGVNQKKLSGGFFWEYAYRVCLGKSEISC